MPNMFFTLRGDIALCAHSVRVNDVPVIEDAKGYPVTVEVPINQFLKNGVNIISCTLTPMPDTPGFDKEAHATVEMKGRAANASRGDAVVLTRIALAYSAQEQRMVAHDSSPVEQRSTSQNFILAPNGDITIGAVKLVTDPNPARNAAASRALTLSVPFPPWTWLTAQPVNNDPETFAALSAEYKKLWDLLNARRGADAERMCENKVTEARQALFLTADETSEYLPLTAMLNDETLNLYPWKTDNLKLEVFGDGRLARLVTKKGRSPIVFIEKDRSAGHYIDLIFCRTDKGWLVCR